MIINNDSMKFRRSLQREKIYNLLRSTTTHPTADWIYGKLKSEFPKLSQGTVYRNLSILLNQKKIKKIRNGSTFDRYEANMSLHYHMICKNCGSITDIDIPNCKDVVENTQKFTNFSIESFQIEFYGICENCQKKKV